MIGRRRTIGLGFLVAAAAAALALLFGGSASTASPGRLYLALGDSVAFGYITHDGYAYVNPANFRGYPDDVADALGMTDANASCPGETTSSFLSAAAPDLGCRAYRSHFPLHVSYTGTQHDFATAFVHAHPNTRLVTIDLGANDAFLLQGGCGNDPACVAAGFPALLHTISTNLATTLGDLRAAGFHGLAVVVNYYALNYADATATASTLALNQAIAGAAQAGGGIVADAFTAFQQAAAAAGGDSCKAGLLNASPQDQSACDVHPSLSGHELIAQAVEDAVRAAHDD